MEEISETRKRPFVDEEKKPYGRSIKSPLELFGRNLERPMYPTMLQLCYYCQKSSADRDAFETNSGRWYFTIQMCPPCFEFNRASQEAGNGVIKRYVAQDADKERAKQMY